MDLVVIVGFLFTFGSVGAAFFQRASPAAHYASWMHSSIVPILANLGGTICGFLAIYLFISSLGWANGLLVWVVSGFIFAFIIGAIFNYFYPLVLLLSFAAMAIGVSIWVLDQYSPLHRNNDPLELGNFIKSFMLSPDNESSWAMRSSPDSNIIWETDGVTEKTLKDANNRIISFHSTREGIANINVMGQHPTVLRQNVEHLPWSVELASDLPKKFRPTSLEAAPKSCFGSDNTGCVFELYESFVNAGISYGEICETPSYVAGNGTLLMKLNAKNKQPAYLTRRISAGSGGANSSIKLYWELKPDEIKSICSQEY